jgi:hypothetical protein
MPLPSESAAFTNVQSCSLAVNLGDYEHQKTYAIISVTRFCLISSIIVSPARLGGLAGTG